MAGISCILARPARFFTGALAVLLVGLGYPGDAAAQGVDRPTYVIAFVPVHWSGDGAAFSRAAQTQAELFVRESNIAAYAEVQVVMVEENFTGADLDSPRLVQAVVRFALDRQPADRYVGLTDGDLAPWGEHRVVGYTFGPDSLGMVAETMDAAVTAHEMGHTFALCDEYLYEEWSRQDLSWGCPNPFPAECPQREGRICRGAPAPDGRNSIMGPAGLLGGYAYNTPSYDHLQARFAELFASDGTLPPVSTRLPAPTATPAPEPVFNRPVALANPDLVVVGADGSLFWLAPGPVWHPAWAPDGRSLAFAAAYAGTPDIYRLPADGGTPELLAGGPAGETHPVWLPGGYLLLVSDRDGASRLYRLALSDGSITPLDGLPDPCSWPAVAPDASQLALACAPDGQWRVGIVPLTAEGLVGGGAFRLVSSPEATALAPAWDEAGERLAWAEAGPDGLFAIRVAELATGQQQRLASARPAWYPVWLDGDNLIWQQGGQAPVSLGGARLPAGTALELPAVWRGGTWPALRPRGEP